MGKLELKQENKKRQLEESDFPLTEDDDSIGGGSSDNDVYGG